MSKKSRKRNKKILAALALAGGAAMLAKGRGRGSVSTAGQPVGVGRISTNTPPIGGTDHITKAVAPVDDSWLDTPIGPHGAGGKGDYWRRQKLPKGILPPSELLAPQRTGTGPRRFIKGGGIAKRGTGAAYKSGGRVKSMGIAKRGGGAAKR